MAVIRESGEDYLEAILQLENDAGQVRSVDVANKLSVTRPSVNKAIAALKEEGLVTQELYGNISLTPKGREYAKEVMERHCTLRDFLKTVLGVDDENAEADACRMEHIISDQTFRGIKKMLAEHHGE